MIELHLRDINGNRVVQTYETREMFLNNFKDVENDDFDDTYEIMLIFYNSCCIYSALMPHKLYIDDVIGFFG